MHRTAVLLTLLSSGCGFDGNASNNNDATNRADSAPSSDARVDQPGPDAMPVPPRRAVDGLVARWNFDSVAGAHIIDEVDPTANLTILGTAFQLVSENGKSAGLKATGPLTVASSGVSKIRTACAASDEFTVEIWIASVPSTSTRNVFWLGDTTIGNLQLQSGDTYTKVLSKVSGGGQFSYVSNPALPGAKAQIVMRFAQSEELEFIFNGERKYTAAVPSPDKWAALQSASFFHSPNAASSTDWQGTIYLAAMYCRVLTDIELALHRELGSEAL